MGKSRRKRRAGAVPAGQDDIAHHFQWWETEPDLAMTSSLQVFVHHGNCGDDADGFSDGK